MRREVISQSGDVGRMFEDIRRQFFNDIVR